MNSNIYVSTDDNLCWHHQYTITYTPKGKEPYTVTYNDYRLQFQTNYYNYFYNNKYHCSLGYTTTESIYYSCEGYSCPSYCLECQKYNYYYSCGDG